MPNLTGSRQGHMNSRTRPSHIRDFSVHDPNGDHLLGCGHGPLRIRCHDALSFISCTPNQQLLEQRVSGHTNDRPGDIFHPNFADDRPTYFDLSLCNKPLNPGIVNCSCATAGSAGLQGEMLKDARHASTVEGIEWKLWDCGLLIPGE